MLNFKNKGMYIIISLILIITVGIISYLKQLSKFRKDHSDFFNYSIAVVAVFLGAFVAIYLNDQSAISAERSKVEKLLNASVEELNSIILEVEVGQKFIKDNSKNIRIFLSNNPMPFPRTYPRLLNNEYILKQIYGSTYRVLNTSLRNLENYYSSTSKINEIMSYDDDKLYLLIEEYRKELNCIRKILLTETEYLGKNKSRENFDKIIDDILANRDEL